MISTRIARAFSIALLVAVGVVSGPSSYGRDKNRTASPAKVAYSEFTLDNGLRVVVSEDHSAPVVAVAVYYDVGSRNEVKGRSGFAHLFEHMMFQGSANVAKTQYFKYVENNGGSLNGTTHLDYTDYCEFLPSNQLELALWLESDRMRSLKINPENLKNQKDAVEEEKRLSIDNQAYEPELEGMEAMMFHNWALAHPTMGSMADLDAATVPDVQRFFDIYYAPNNAVLVVAGDVDSQQTEKWVRKYFATIPRHEPPPAVNLAEPEDVITPKKVATDKQAQVPAIAIAWKIPPRRSPDSYAITLLSSVLLDGESSRLYQDLVKKNAIALQVQGSLDLSRGPSEITIITQYKPGQKPEEVEHLIEGEIDQIKQDGITDEELTKVKNQYRLGRYLDGRDGEELATRQTALGRAMALGEFTLFDNDPSLINSEADRYLSVTGAQIQAAARKYFGKDNRVVLYIEPGAGQDDQDSKPGAAKKGAAN